MKPTEEFALSSGRHQRVIHAIPEELMARLTSYEWPENIRELQNFTERSVILTSGPVLHSLAAGLPVQNDTPPRMLVDAERSLIIGALRDTKWVVGGGNGAAHRLGVKRTTLLARMKKLGISRERIRGASASSDSGLLSMPA
jgi:DNA-binding NtrC family response regulator